MADNKEVASLYKKEIILPPALGDWTEYRPAKSAQKKVKPLTYTSPRISKSALNKTLKVHYLFANDFSRFLKESLKASIDIHSIAVEQVTYLDFLKTTSDGVIYNKLFLKSAGEIMFIMDYQMANTAINFSLGCQSFDTNIRELTELEESILQSIYGNMMKYYTESWLNTFEKPEAAIISYPAIQRENNINLNEVITFITVKLSIANAMPTSFVFAFQNITLKKMLETLVNKEEKLPLNFSRLPEEMLNAIEVPVTAELGTTSIYANELPSIDVDDLIELDQKINDPVRLILGGTSELKAQPGLKSGKLSVRVLGGGAKRVKMKQMAKIGKESDEASFNTLPAEELHEDFEIPLEEKEDQGYNENTGLIEDDNENSRSEPGGI